MSTVRRALTEARTFLGDFGGGWERELGLQLGPRGLRGTVIVNLWRGSVRVDPGGV